MIDTQFVTMDNLWLFMGWTKQKSVEGLGEFLLSVNCQKSDVRMLSLFGVNLTQLTLRDKCKTYTELCCEWQLVYTFSEMCVNRVIWETLIKVVKFSVMKHSIYKIFTKQLKETDLGD